MLTIAPVRIQLPSLTTVRECQPVTAQVPAGELTLVYTICEHPGKRESARDRNTHSNVPPHPRIVNSINPCNSMVREARNEDRRRVNHCYEIISLRRRASLAFTLCSKGEATHCRCPTRVARRSELNEYDNKRCTRHETYHRSCVKIASGLA